MTGVIYARYSEGPHQTDQSIEGQVAECKEFARSKGIDIVEIYAGRHISGKYADNRVEFQRMLSDAETHRFDAVIVWKIDRFGRNRQDIAFGKYRLKKAGVQLMYAAESVPDGPEGIVLESVLEGIAEYYSAELRQKVTRGIRESAKKGRPNGPLPIGYKLGENRRPVIDEPKAAVVRECFQMYLHGAQEKDLVKYLRARGITGQRGGKINNTVVYRMLRNPRYLGIFDYQDIEIRVDPIIDQETFDMVQTLHPTSRNNGRGKAEISYLLSCKCFCGYCGAMLIGEKGTGHLGKAYYYYKCGAKKRGKKDCELKPVRKEVLEQAVIKATMEDMLTDETIDALAEEVMRIQAEELEDDPVNALRSRQKSLEQKIRNITRAIEDAPGSRALTTRLVELEQEEKNVAIQITKAELSRPQLSADIVRSWLTSFRIGDVTDPDFCTRLVETFVAKVDVYNEKAMIYYNISNKKRGSHTDPKVRIRPIEWSQRNGIRTGQPFVYKDYFVLLIDYQETQRIS